MNFLCHCHYMTAARIILIMSASSDATTSSDGVVMLPRSLSKCDCTLTCIYIWTDRVRGGGS